MIYVSKNTKTISRFLQLKKCKVYYNVKFTQPKFHMLNLLYLFLFQWKYIENITLFIYVYMHQINTIYFDTHACRYTTIYGKTYLMF